MAGTRSSPRRLQAYLDYQRELREQQTQIEHQIGVIGDSRLDDDDEDPGNVRENNRIQAMNELGSVSDRIDRELDRIRTQIENLELVMTAHGI